jgi:hypothetical protein
MNLRPKIFSVTTDADEVRLDAGREVVGRVVDLTGGVAA